MIAFTDKYLAYLFAAIVGIIFAAGWGSHVLYSNSVNQAIAETRKAAAESAASEIAKIQITNTTVQGKIIERVRTEVVYSECHHSPDTFSIIKDAFGDKK